MAENGGALVLAAREGHLPVVRYLVEHGVPASVGGDLALALATQNGHSDVVRYFVEHAGGES